jgi:hypothetical protein
METTDHRMRFSREHVRKSSLPEMTCSQCYKPIVNGERYVMEAWATVFGSFEAVRYHKDCA